jgi:transcriptional regulator with XRE-family HTH domain
MSDEFEEKAYREAFVAENISTGIAFQIRALRKKEVWSQEELGNRSGKPQNVISRLENPDYGKFTISTLLDIASAFDVALMVRFVPFSCLRFSLNDLSESALAVPKFEEERRDALSPRSIPSQLEWLTFLSTGVVSVGSNFGFTNTESGATVVSNTTDNPVTPISVN